MCVWCLGAEEGRGSGSVCRLPLLPSLGVPGHCWILKNTNGAGLVLWPPCSVKGLAPPALRVGGRQIFPSEEWAVLVTRMSAHGAKQERQTALSDPSATTLHSCGHQAAATGPPNWISLSVVSWPEKSFPCSDTAFSHPMGYFPPFPTHRVNPSNAGMTPSVARLSGFPSELFKEAQHLAVLF